MKKQKRRGFTLIEMIGVIIIVSLLAFLLFPSILKQINNNRKKIDKITEKLLFSAASLYLDNKQSEYLKIEGSTYCINLRQLVEDEKIEEPILDSEGNVVDLNNIISVNVKNNHYNFSMKSSCVNEIPEYVVRDFKYLNTFQEFVVPHSGIYKIELWGASGGDNSEITFFAENAVGELSKRTLISMGALGSYTSGEIRLEKGTLLYFYIGEVGKRNLKTTFNGGGSGALGGAGYNGTNLSGRTDSIGLSGGGATDVRLVSGEWNDFNSLKSRIMVAAGGGGATGEVYSDAGGISYAGGLTGYSGGYYAGHPFVDQNGKGGTQTAGGSAALIHFNATGKIEAGSFGYGGSTSSISSQVGAGGGGGGYYGGGGASGTLAGGIGQGGGGGSSFISGHNGCKAISETSTISNITHLNSEVHYSGYKFINTIMVDGSGYNWTNVKGKYTEMPTYNGKSKMMGNLGNGYAKITFMNL